MPNLKYFKMAVTPQLEPSATRQEASRQYNSNANGSYFGKFITSAVSSIRGLAERMSMSKRREEQRKQEEEWVETSMKVEAIGFFMASTGACCVEFETDEMTKATIFIMEK